MYEMLDDGSSAVSNIDPVGNCATDPVPGGTRQSFRGPATGVCTMRMNAYPVIASVSVAIGALLLGTPVHAEIQTGTLACNVGSGPGFIIGSSRPLDCTYSGPAGSEHYVGNIAKLGVDFGYLQSSEMVWQVVASNAYPGPGSLAGNYGGVTASAAVGGGVGANALVGGSDRLFVLQPVSVVGQIGFDLSVGLATVSLQYAP